MKFLESKPVIFVVFVAAFAFLGTYFTMVVPLVDESLYEPTADAKDYTPLELEGKRIYEKEGCCVWQYQQPSRW